MIYEPKISIVEIANQHLPKERKHLGRMRLQKGMSLYEVDYDEQVVREAEYQSEVLDIGTLRKPKKQIVRRVLTKPNCLYIQALNPQNALRKAEALVSKL